MPDCPDVPKNQGENEPCLIALKGQNYPASMPFAKRILPGSIALHGYDLLVKSN